MKILRRFVLAFISAVIITAAFLSVYRKQPEPILLLNARVLDPEKRVENVESLLLRDGRIERVFSSVPDLGNVKKLDLAGKWVIPGLVDLHSHSWGNTLPDGSAEYLGHLGASKRMAEVGVISFLDLFSGESYIFRSRTIQQYLLRWGHGEYADIFAAGPLFTCTGGHGTEYEIKTRVINTPEEARHEVSDLIRNRHPDVIKIAYDHARSLPGMNRKTMEAAVATANENHLKTVIHIGNWKDATEAVLAGASVITHLYEEDIPDLVKLMKERGTISIPTMTVQTELYHIAQDQTLLDRPALKSIESAKILETLRSPDRYSKAAKNWMEWQKQGEASYRRSLQKLFRAGVPILVGTDSGNFGVFQGYAVHREMQLLSDAGIPGWDVLADATTSSGKFLGEKYGVNEGDEASVVVLNRSPIENIRNTEDIFLVIHHGFVIRTKVDPTGSTLDH